MGLRVPSLASGLKHGRGPAATTRADARPDNLVGGREFVQSDGVRATRPWPGFSDPPGVHRVRLPGSTTVLPARWSPPYRPSDSTGPDQPTLLMFARRLGARLPSDSGAGVGYRARGNGPLGVAAAPEDRIARRPALQSGIHLREDEHESASHSGWLCELTRRAMIYSGLS